MRSTPASHTLFLLVILCSLSCATGGSAPRRPAPARPPNIVFIAVDDLRPELPMFGPTQAHAPNLVRFAAESATFHRHYVQAPTCGASRYALLTGRRPRRDAELTNEPWHLLDATSREAQSFPELFRRGGYRTVSLGKITHSPSGRGGARGDGAVELPNAWDEVTVPLGPYRHAWELMHGYAGGVPRKRDLSPTTEAADVPDEGYADGLIAAEAIRRLESLSAGGSPFLLAVGFIKPHLPFACPRRYWDLYRRDEIRLSEHAAPPKEVGARISLHSMGEFRGNYAGAGPVDDDEARLLRHGYLACISYVDAQIGKVLAALDRLGRRDDTLVVVWGDHGFHLGDLSLWGKHTVFEWSLRSPLMIRGPGVVPHDHRGLVEALDLYPTLAALANLQPPSTVKGRSFARLLRAPAAGGKSEAFGYWKNGAAGRGTTIRTDRYRLVRWVRDGQVVQTELYDHQSDPGETTNIAASHALIVEQLVARLQAEDPRYPFE